MESITNMFIIAMPILVALCIVNTNIVKDTLQMDMEHLNDRIHRMDVDAANMRYDLNELKESK